MCKRLFYYTHMRARTKYGIQVNSTQWSTMQRTSLFHNLWAVQIVRKQFVSDYGSRCDITSLEVQSGVWSAEPYEVAMPRTQKGSIRGTRRLRADFGGRPACSTARSRSERDDRSLPSRRAFIRAHWTSGRAIPFLVGFTSCWACGWNRFLKSTQRKLDVTLT